MLATSTVVRDIKGGLVAATACIAFSIANGALLYSGAGQPMLARGIGAGLLTTAIVCIAMSAFSGFRPVVATANSITAAPLGAIVASTAPALAALSQEEAIATVYALVALMTVSTGAILLLLGSARLGTIVRFIPHPVVAGFMGVNGTLLLFGAIRFGTGIPVLWRNLPGFLQPTVAAEFGLAIAFAVCAGLVTRKIRHPLGLPALLISTIVGANAIVGTIPASGAHSFVDTFFLAPRTAMPLATPILFDTATPVAWDLLWTHLPAVPAYAFLVTLSTLLTSVGLETALNVDLRFNRELRAQGAAVIASGLAGGFVGNASVGSTLAGIAGGAQGRITGIMAGIAAFIFLLFGRPLIPFIPRFVIAGFLLEIGFWIVLTWCWRTRRQMPAGEWLLVIAIVAITVWVGLVPAILAGIVGGCILFALDLSRVDIVKRVYGLNQRTSSLARPGAELAALAQTGGQVRFIELNGTLFFGSAYQIFTWVRRMLDEDPSPRFIVLDLTRVFGGDSSTAAILARMRRLLREHGIAFAVAGGRPALVRLLRSAGVLDAGDGVFASRDLALEAGEALVLRTSGRFPVAPLPLSDWLSDAFGDSQLACALLPHLRCDVHEPGAFLCREGEPTTTLLFIEHGRVAVVVGAETEPTVVRVFGPGTMAGEHGFILQAPRTASLRVEQQAKVWSLARDDFDRLSNQQPELVIALMRDIIRLQSERLAFATRQNAALA